MAYTFTERKRIRKSFGSRDSVLEVPYLLQMQKDAYTAFLQADVAPKKRTQEGLQAASEVYSSRKNAAAYNEMLAEILTAG